MERIVQLRLRESGQPGVYLLGELTVKTGDCVIVEADRGLDYGQAISEPLALDDPNAGTLAEESLRKVVRLVTAEDLKQIEENRFKAKESFDVCQKKIEEHALSMKLVDAEYSFDQSKMIFYFTAEGRVDFRELVKDLAKIFKTRIELRQIGVRDEARLFGGFGVCGRQLCCATFLKDFQPVTIKMAKEQGLPLNPPKISGVCGRLMCCLSYEFETYRHLCRGLPREGETISIKEGKGKVVSVNTLKRSVLVGLEDGRQIVVKYEEVCQVADNSPSKEGDT